ncbi:hypothetical protein HUT06_03205 [Actinomadura sp. NAK00032]|uniref:hypothetical protein n=1 Tax=Actinomadura sp. NAK00032 TaxID=2742128 RepID=UPI0015903AB6|nr:hypothetical protein [Actinomadura sp. NAK00032]QKW33167.1 hypothetical protein HUT06_03205 [Actinomadura sp. NAK00032]
MNRLLVGVASGVTVAVAVPIAAIIGLTALEENWCKGKTRELNSVRGAVAADLEPLHNTSLDIVAVCDSGDPPYLITDLKSSIRPEQATGHLRDRGWRLVETYRLPNGEKWGRTLEKRYQAKSAVLVIHRDRETDAVDITINLD